MDDKTFWLICDEANQCHCDWRVTIVNCAEGHVMFYIYVVNAIFSFLVSLLGIIWIISMYMYI